MSMSDMPTPAPNRTPTVYFIDDSATMREVIKIAFRKENIHVVTCPDAASALAQFTETPPDAVITDVIMPDKDGYEVCEFIKQHDQLAKTPVILMSGVVNRTVAERAMAARADELIRKPFQPQDLIARVRKLLNPEATAVMRGDDGNLNAYGAPREKPNPLRDLFAAGTPSANAGGSVPRFESPVAVASHPSLAATPWTRTAPEQKPPAASAADIQKLRNEVRRLEMLAKKLQAELEAQREYCAALEAHLKALEETE
jgi:CheY-like chemotaxis protein